MKTTDADLIEKLNALPDEDRADLLEFLGGSENLANTANALRDRLEASLELHRQDDPKTKH